MSLTMDVPTVVPSVVHNSPPCPPSLALKKSTSLKGDKVSREIAAPRVDIFQHGRATGERYPVPADIDATRAVIRSKKEQAVRNRGELCY